MASQQSQGIQTLLEAEKEASKVVEQARQYRVQKLKDARSQAAKDIEQYKKSKEAEFTKIENDRKGATKSTQSSVDQETEKKLAAVKESFAQHRDDVVKKLLDRVVLVKPELHKNLSKIESK